MEKLSALNKIIISILIISFLTNSYTFYLLTKNIPSENIPADNNQYSESLELIDPDIAELEVTEFLKAKSEYTASYSPLRDNINRILANTSGHFGVYFEDLHSHSWLGINEKEKFKPASLMKVTTVMAILSLIEQREISLDDKVKIKREDLNSRYGTLYQNEGAELTVKELIQQTLQNSDNTAVNALHTLMPEEKWVETRLALGLPIISVLESEQGSPLTPKEYSRVFQALYYSGYISRESSNWVLSLMSETKFTEGIPSGVPKDVKVSHKIGVWVYDGGIHDCGIVYGKKPYLICIMGRSTTEYEGNKVIKEISKEVYQYVSQH